MMPWTPSAAMMRNQSQHDRAEGSPDRRRPERLDREQRQQNRGRRRQHVGLQARRDLLHAFERRQHRNRRRDRAVAVDQRRAEQAGGDNQRPLMPLDAEQGHQRDDAALAVIVDAHGDIDVFDRRDEEQRPDDERQGAQRRRRVGMGPGVVEHGLQRVERARADVAEHHAERRDAGEPKSPDRLRLGAGLLRSTSRSPTRPSDARSPGCPSIRGRLKQIGDACRLRLRRYRPGSPRNLPTVNVNEFWPPRAAESIKFNLFCFAPAKPRWR